jgi:hypothetical protein
MNTVANTWDDGYPAGGNYWSDYVTRYPSASEIDASGLWDTPYVINENNQDNYPLMLPSADVDNDGIPDHEDNCWLADNPGQEDTDGDCPESPYIIDPACGDACDPPYVCGDTDGDEEEAVNILDIVYLINYLYKGGPEPLCEPVSVCADVNTDDDINILDIVYLINYLYKSGPEPVCP